MKRPLQARPKSILSRKRKSHDPRNRSGHRCGYWYPHGLGLTVGKAWRLRGWIAALFLVLGLALSATAPAVVPVPASSARVTDLTATLKPEQLAALEARLRAFEARKGSQLVVLIVPTTQPEAIEQFALRVAGQWKIGRQRVDDGALLLVAKDDRTVRIEVGYGLEGVLSDAVSKRIIDEFIVPNFRRGDYAAGIESGVSQMIRLVDGEPLPPAKPESRVPAAQAELGLLLPALLVAVVAGGVLRAVFGRLPAALLVGGAMGYVLWFLSGALALALLGGVVGFFVTLLGSVGGPGGHGGGWQSPGSGGIRSGGFGGGFRGGGGGFGGGGASGRW